MYLPSYIRYSVSIRGDHMKDMNKETFIHRRKTRIQKGSGLLPLLTVWGIQWIANAGLDAAEEWYNLEQAKLVLVLLTVLVSVWLAGRLFLNERRSGNQDSKNATSSRPGENSTDSKVSAVSLLIPGAMLIGAVWLLEGIGAVGPLFVPIFRACLVAVVYVQFGVWLGKSLIFLGLWLFALAVVMGIWFLGFSGIVLEGMGGISLLVCSWMLHSWSR